MKPVKKLKFVFLLCFLNTHLHHTANLLPLSCLDVSHSLGKKFDLREHEKMIVMKWFCGIVDQQKCFDPLMPGDNKGSYVLK